MRISNKFIPLYCVICKKRFFRVRKNVKRARLGLNCRSKNVITCTKYCSFKLLNLEYYGVTKK